MDLSDILKKHEASKKDNLYYNQSSLTSANSSAVGKLIEALPLQSLLLLRTLHQELTLTNYSSDTTDSFLIDHIDTNIALLTAASYSTLKYDKNIELGFMHQKKMKGLLDILKWLVSSNITLEEFNALYDHWLKNYEIKNLTQTKSSQEINEVFSLFLIIEEGPEFLLGLAEKVQVMLEALNMYHYKELSADIGVSEEWNFSAEEIFEVLDSEGKGHLDGEDLQFLVLGIILPELRSLEPIMLRKQTQSMLLEMSATNGIVTLRCFKNYLIQKNWTKLEDLIGIQEKLTKIKKVVKKIKFSIMRKEVEELSDCLFLAGCKKPFPSIWSQSINLSLSPNIKNWEKLQKFLKFSAWSLGSTSNASNKGESFIKGTYLRDIPEFAVYLMTNFLEFEGQFHTSVSLASINQQTICRVSSDLRFQAIHKALISFDRIMNAIIYEVISKYEFRGEKKVIKTVAVSLATTLNSTGKNEPIRSVSPKIVPRINSNKNMPVSVSVKLIAANKGLRTNSRNSNRSKSPGPGFSEKVLNRSKSPVLGRLESYDKVMQRLKK